MITWHATFPDVKLYNLTVGPIFPLPFPQAGRSVILVASITTAKTLTLRTLFSVVSVEFQAAKREDMLLYKCECEKHCSKSCGSISFDVAITQIPRLNPSASTAPRLGTSDVDKIPTDCRNMCLLLLCCGDVETNPGPATGQGQSTSSGAGSSGSVLKVNSKDRLCVWCTTLYYLSEL